MLIPMEKSPLPEGSEEGRTCNAASHRKASLDDLDMHSGSQLHEKSKTSLSVFLQISQLLWMKFSLSPQPSVFFFVFFSRAWTNFMLYD